MRLEGKIAIVTGGASGFGRGIAERFVREGARVIVADLNGAAAAEVVQSFGNGAIAVEADVTKKGDVQQVIATADEVFGA